MKNHELLDLIGEVKEDYVLAADKPVRRARPRWQIWAACAACAALIAAAYPVCRAFQPQPPLHSYTMAEAGSTAVIKTPYRDSGADAPAPDPDPIQPPRGDGPDVPVNRAPYDQYNALIDGAGLEQQLPDWFGGAYVQHDDAGYPTRLAICIVEGCRTPELENQIWDWCGAGELSFQTVRYSRGYLQELMERMNGSEFLAVTKEDPAVFSWGVYVEGNCIQFDCRSVPSDATLAALAELDPDGDAIQVRVLTGQTVNPDIVKDPAPGGTPEEDQPARRDLLPAGE